MAAPIANPSPNPPAITKVAAIMEPTPIMSSDMPASQRSLQGNSVKLSVPIDAQPSASALGQTVPAQPRPLRRRDSLERREALLRGKEGSRQRRRWENDRLLSNPYAQPPLPSDYLVPSTHPVRTVPYYLAPLWDAAEFQRAVESKLHGRRSSRTIFRKKRQDGYAGVYGYGGMSPMEMAAVNVPREIKEKLKWRRGGWARGLLKDLEEDVRGWVGGVWNKEKEEQEEVVNEDTTHAKRGNAVLSGTDTDTEDEEIVFVGRQGSTTSLPRRTKSQASLRSQYTTHPQQPSAGMEDKAKETEQEKERQETISDSKLIYEGLEDDKSASFARWLVHCVGSYYGLRTWSVTKEVVVVEVEGKTEKETASEVRREVHVGVDRRARGFMGRGERFGSGREVELPRPLWGMV